MTISNTSRRAGPFVGNGLTTSFAFPFKVFANDQVMVTAATGAEERVLRYGTDYSVVLNASGGTVTLTSPLPAGDKLAITSAVPYDQPMVLTNKGGFYPTVLNDNADLQCAQIQQLKELADRHLAVPATSTRTAEEVMKDILDTALHAGEYAQQASETLRETLALKETVDTNVEAAVKAAEDAKDFKDAVEDLAGPVLDIADELRAVSQIAGDVSAVGESIGQVKLVADVLETDADVEFSHDFGVWPRNDTNGSRPAGGTIYAVADNIEDIRQVGQNLNTILDARDYATEARQSASSALAAEARIQALEQEIRELISTNYAAVAEGQ